MIPWAIRLERAILAGMCVRCREPAMDGLCDGCVDAAAIKRDAQRAERAALSLCRCGRPPKGDMHQCSACLSWDRDRKRTVRLSEARGTEQGLMDK